MDTSEYKPTEDEERFLRYYKKLIWETINALAHLGLWESLENFTSNYLDELNHAPLFFKFTIKAHFDDALLTLSRILDQHEDSLSIWKFLNFAEQNLDIFCTQAFQRHRVNKPNYSEHWIESHVPITLEEIREHRKELEGLKDIINSIKTWRDKALAHIDRKFFLRRRNVSVQRQKVKEVIEVLAKILNRYSVAYDSSRYSLRTTSENDVQVVMDSIRFQKEERKKQLEALRKQALDKS